MNFQHFTSDQYGDAFTIYEEMKIIRETMEYGDSIHHGQHPEHGELTLIMLGDGGAIMVTSGVKFIAAAA